MSGELLDQIGKEADAAQKRDAKEGTGKKYITAVNEKYGSDAVRKSAHYRTMTQAQKDEFYAAEEARRSHTFLLQ